MKLRRVVSFIIVTAILLGMVPAISLPAGAETYYSYRVSPEEGATLTKVPTSVSGDVVLPADVSGYPLVKIAASAFYNCSKITSITIPDTVKEIGVGAFRGCSNLYSITLPFVGTTAAMDESTYHSFASVFGQYNYTGAVATEQRTDGLDVSYSGNSYTTYYLPDTLHNVTVTGGYVSAYSFRNCNKLTNIQLGDRVTKIEQQAFYNCSGLTHITIGNGVTEIGSSAFYNCSNLTQITIPESVRTIGGSAFSGCTGLTSMTLPFVGASRTASGHEAVFGYIFGYTYSKYATNGTLQYSDNNGGYYYKIPSVSTVTVTDMTCIPYSAFTACKNITKIVLPEKLTEIKHYAFSSCIKLKDIIIPESVTEIGDNAFTYCKALESITVPEGVHRLYYDTFKNCVNLSQIYLPDDCIIEAGVFENTKCYTDTSFWEDDVLYIDKHLIKANTSIAGNYHVKEGTRSIAAEAFYGCKNLQSVSVSEPCKNIGYWAFMDCENLTEIMLPDSIRKISYRAFKNNGYYNDPENWEEDALYVGNHLVAVRDTISGSCTIRPGTLSIAHETFLWAVDLTSLTIPESVVCIGPDQTFWGEIESVHYEGNAEQWSQIEFWWYEDSNPMKSATKTYFNNEPLKTVYFPSVAKIGANSFCYNPNIETLIIGNSVQQIGSMAFAGCSNISAVYYLGTRSDWDAMDIAEDSGLQDKNIQFVGKHDFIVADAEANCEKGAGKEFTCKDCGYVFRVEMSAPLGHSHQQAETIAPTCTEKGYTVYRCHCGNSYNTNYIKELGHDHQPGETVSPTPSEFGYTTYVCSRCEDSYQADWKAPVAGITGTCGEDAVWRFDEQTGVLTIRGKGKVQDYETGNAPWDGYNQKIYAVSVGTGITEIGENAFAACTKIVEIENGSELSIVAGSSEHGGIGKNAKNIYAMGMGESKLSYQDGFVFLTHEGMGYCVDYTGSDVILNLPEKYTDDYGMFVDNYELMDYALAYNAELLIVKVPNSVYKIGQNTFVGSNLIADLYIYNYECELVQSGNSIPKEITIHGYEGSSAEHYATQYGNSFVSVTKDYPTGQCGQSAVWTLNLDTGALRITGNGSIYDYEQGLAPWYAYKEEIKSIYIASGIVTVGNYCFYGLNKAQYLDLGYSIRQIGVGAFMDCGALTAVVFPETLVSMGQNAFANCSGLTAVVIPDRLGEMEEGVFYNCVALQSVTIGSSVTHIKHNAFTNCESLSVIKMRGAPPVVNEQVFGAASGKYVYYYTTVPGWDAVVSGGLWNGYTAIPYNAITETGFNGTNVFSVKVVDRYNQAIQNATVTFGTVTKATDDDGIAYFVLNTQAQRLVISASGFAEFTDDSYLSNTGRFMEIISLSDSPSTVAGVSCDGKSIATSVAQINCNSDANIRIRVSGYCPRTILRYELLQGNRILATASTASRNATFSVSAKSFEEGETVQVRMYISDGSYVASALNIQVLNIADFSEEAFINGLENVNISLPVVGNIPFAFAIKNPALTDVVVDGDTVKIGINIDLTEDTDITNIQKQIRNAKKQAANRVTSAKAGFSGEISGYLEIKYMGNNQYIISKSQVSLVVGAGLSASAQASYFGIVGVYFKVGLTTTGELALSFSGYDVDEGFQFDELDLNVENMLRVEGGGYLLWGAGKVGFYGQGTMGFGLEIAPDFGVEKVYIKGEMGVSWSVLWGWIQGSKVIWDGTLYEYDVESTRNMRKLLNANLRSALQDPENYLLNDRNYLADRSGWYSRLAKDSRNASEKTSGTIQSNIYYNVEPKLVACGDTIMMLWLDDNSERDIHNYQTLYYSTYHTDTKLWSVPVRLDGNNTFDCEFDVCSDGENIYVICTEKTGFSGDIEHLDLTNEAQISQVIGDVEVTFHTYNGTGFEQTAVLTNNSVCETLPEIHMIDGTLTATWSTLEPIGVSGISKRNNAVCSAECVDGVWSAPKVLMHDMQQVYAVSSGILSDKKYTAYTVDTDGSSDTTDDLALLLVDQQENMAQVASGAIKSVQFVHVSGKDLLMWNDENNIYYIASDNATIHKVFSKDTVISGSFACTKVDNELSLISYISATEGEEGTELFGIYFDGSKTVGSSIRYTETEGFVDSFGIEYAQNSLLISYVESIVNINGEEMDTTAYFRYIVVPCCSDVEITDVDYDITQIQPGKEFSAIVHLKNNGLKPITNVSICLHNNSHEEISKQECTVQILPGMAAEIPVTLAAPAQIIPEQFNLAVLTSDEEGECDTYPFTIGFADLKIHAEQKIIAGKNYILYSVANDGNMDAIASIKICENSAVLASIQDVLVVSGASAQYIFDAAKIQGGTLISAEVSANVLESNPLDNTVSIHLLNIDTSVYEYTEKDVVNNPVLSTTGVTYDKYTDETVSIGIEEGIEQFSGIQDLTAGVDYTVNNTTITVSKTYLQSLSNGVTTLTFLFSYLDTQITRTINVKVMDSAPIPVCGTLAIDGVACVGNTISANITGLTPFGATYDYRWSIGGVTVGNDEAYTISAEDYGKAITLTATAKNGYTGNISCFVVVDYQTQRPPVTPVAVMVGDTSVQLLKVDGIEYSVDLEQWQTGGLFEGLLPNTKYTFYARYKATATCYASDASPGLQITTAKSMFNAPDAPTVKLIGDTIVVLWQHEGYEYSMDGALWQESNRFEGLRPNTEYVFYVRWKETDSNYTSPVSVATVVTTLKTEVEPPAAPEVLTAGDTTVQLVEHTGLEYSMDRENWYTSGLFSGLLPNREYSFYARRAETGTTYASLPSAAVVVTTKKVTVQAPATPVAEHIGARLVILQFRAGCEYSMDGTSWQYSNIFERLQPNTEYVFYVRFEETEASYASPASPGLRITTDKSVAEKPTAPILELRDVTGITLQWQTGYEYSLDGTIWQDSAVFANLQPDTEYTFYQRVKETDAFYASPASDGLTVRTKQKPVVEVLADGNPTGYPTLTEAISAAPAGTILRLLEDVTEEVTIDKNVILDLNGFDLVGDVAASSGAVLVVKDSQTDDYTIEDVAGYGRLIGTVSGVQADAGYLMITGEEGVSFHRIDLSIHAMTLRPSVVGVYYQSNFAGDEIVAQNVERYGIALSVRGIPTQEDMGICSWYDTFTAGDGRNTANGTLLRGVMKQTNSQSENEAQAEMLVYGRAYILTKDGQYVLGDAVSRSLRQQVELINDQWDALSPDQTVAVLEMYENYKTIVGKWNIPNIQSAIK